MTQDDTNRQELISALADGQLSAEELVQALDWLECNEEAQANWHAYHLVGDVLRSGQLAALGANDSAFVARLRPRLQDEPGYRQPGSTGGFEPREESANDANLRWKLVAGLATVTAVAALSWELVSAWVAPMTGPQLARMEVRPSQEQAQVMIRDPLLDRFLAAHQQSGGISALQTPAVFLRNATYDRSER